jgi:hypothetical protein
MLHENDTDEKKVLFLEMNIQRNSTNTQGKGFVLSCCWLKISSKSDYKSCIDSYEV